MPGQRKPSDSLLVFHGNQKSKDMRQFSSDRIREGDFSPSNVRLLYTKTRITKLYELKSGPQKSQSKARYGSIHLNPRGLKAREIGTQLHSELEDSLKLYETLSQNNNKKDAFTNLHSWVVSLDLLVSTFVSRKNTNSSWPRWPGWSEPVTEKMGVGKP